MVSFDKASVKHFDVAGAFAWSKNPFITFESLSMEWYWDKKDFKHLTEA